MKNFFLLIILLRSLLANGQHYYADIHNEEITPNNPAYQITFASYPADENSMTGHMFVIWQKELPNGLLPIGSFGFYPAQDPSIRGKGVVYGLREGVVLPEIEEEMKLINKTATFRIDNQQFQKTLGVKDKWASQPPNYSLLLTNCIAFAKDVGTSIGLLMPDRSPMNATPDSYMQSFLNELEQAKIQTIDNQNIEVFDNADYRVGTTRMDVNGEKQYFTGRQRISFQNGPVVEGNYFRGQQHGPECYFYPSGQIWYRDNEKDPEVSVLKYQNGNILFNYDPNSNAQHGQILLKNGDLYLGESKDGLPDGNGELWGTADRTYVNGSFNKGKLVGYHDLYLPNGIYNGTLKNGYPSGPAKFIFSDGAIYEGSFKNGKFDGYGKLIYPDRKTTANGNFSDGIFTEGKFTLPNGNYFEGKTNNGFIPNTGVWHHSDGTVIATDSNNSAPDNSDKGRKDPPERRLIAREIDYDKGKDKVTTRDKDGNVVTTERDFDGGGLEINMNEKK